MPYRASRHSGPRSERAPIHSEGCPAAADRLMCETFWKQVVKISLFHKWKIILILFIAVVPFLWAVSQMHYGIDGTNLYVRSDAARIAESEMENLGLQVGRNDPLKIMMMLNNTEVSTSEAGTTTQNPVTLAATNGEGDDCIDLNDQVAIAAAAFGIDNIDSCLDFALTHGIDCSKWSYDGTDISVLASIYCPVTCNLCAQLETNIWRSEEYYNYTQDYVHDLFQLDGYGLNDNMSVQAISNPFSYDLDFSNATELLADAEFALQYIQYEGCFQSDFPERRVYYCHRR
jgi:hypothetical protein